jgi:ribosomal protein L35
MKGMKTNKSYSKRLKLTKNGKVIARKPGFNHFNAKQSRGTQLAGRKGSAFEIKNKPKSHLLPFN